MSNEIKLESGPHHFEEGEVDDGPHPKGRGSWYYIEIHYCPVCGSTRTFRERQDSPRPEHWDDRHGYHEFYDYCDAL